LRCRRRWSMGNCFRCATRRTIRTNPISLDPSNLTIGRHRQRQLQGRLVRTSALSVVSRRKRPTAFPSAFEAPCLTRAVTPCDSASRLAGESHVRGEAFLIRQSDQAAVGSRRGASTICGLLPTRCTMSQNSCGRSKANPTKLSHPDIRSARASSVSGPACFRFRNVFTP
jgi:hypothetical protein